MTDMFGPLGYLGVKAPHPCDIIKAQRAPLASDWKYDLGTIWIDLPGDTSYQLVNVSAHIADWQALGGGSVQVDSLVGDNAVHAIPVAGDIIVAGGTNIVTAAAGQTLTVNFNSGSDIILGNIAASGDIIAKSIVTSNTTIPQFNASPVLESAVDTGAAPTGVTGDTNIMSLQGGEIMEQFILGAGQTIIAPRMDAAGLKVSLDLTVAEGAEYNFGVLPISKHAYTVGTSPAVSFELEFKVADVTGAFPILMGFRKQEADNANFAAYTDFAAIGLDDAVNAGTVIIETRLNSGAVVTTNTTNAWVDGATHTLKVLVSAAGVVTYTIDGVAPVVTAAFTFDNGDVIMPYFHFLHGAAAPGAIHWTSMSVGVQ